MYDADECYEDGDGIDYEGFCGECGRHLDYCYCYCEPEWENAQPFATDNLNQIIDSLDASDGIPF